MSFKTMLVELKKVVILVFLLLIVGCGKEKVITTPLEKKRELVGKVLQDDIKAREEYKNIIEKLEKQEREGIKEAKIEREKWSKVEREFFEKQVKEQEKNMKVLIDNREYGY